MSERYAPYRWLILVPVAVAYLASLPRAVQFLDSGELVTSALGLTVPHAPGYPLYVWLYHAFLSVLPVGTVFFRAAFVTSLCALGAAALLLKVTRSWIGVAAIAAMASLPAVWRYAVLPDVFGLNQLLAAALIVAAFSRPTAARPFVASVMFGLGAANHHSVVFLAPLLALVILQEPQRRRGFAALVLGAAIAVSFYASLRLLDTEHVNSWGAVGTFRGIVHHFLRRDYGTFDLTSGGASTDLMGVVRGLVTTLGAFGLGGVAVVAVGAGSARPIRDHRTWWTVLLCLVLYLLIFIPRMNLGGSDDDAIGVRERFFVLPVLLLTALAATAPLQRMKQSLQRGFATVLGLLAVVQIATSDTYGLRRDVVIEEYMRHLLNTAVRRGTPAMLLVDSDTKFFAGRYIQATEPGYEDVFILPRSMTYDRRLLERAKKRWPRLYYDSQKVRTRDKMDIYAQLLAPNMDAFTITHVMPFTSPRGRTVYYPVGRGLEPGTGVAFAEPSALHPSPPVYRAASSQYVDTKEIFAEYAVYYLALGKDLLTKGDKQGARQAFLAGLALVPYCVPCLRNACALGLDDQNRCDEAVAKLQSSEYDYFK